MPGLDQRRVAGIVAEHVTRDALLDPVLRLLQRVLQTQRE
jgi:hypothetical protein